VIDPRRRGSNPKVANLLNMLPRAAHDMLVIADSDIAVRPDYLQAIAGELQRPGVGGVTCLYHGVAGTGVWARLSALAINSHFLPNVVLALRLALARPCFGSTIALKRDTLRRIGGLEAFADTLADDYAIGAAIRATGLQVAIPPFSVSHACFERSLATLLAHDLRVARTIKSIDPLGYYGAVLTHPLPLALLAIPAGGSAALLVTAAALACRVMLCLCVERTFGLTRQPFGLIPLRDLLSFSVYVCSLFGTAVDWRGTAYKVCWDGRLVPDGRQVGP
jgi:ceramide glucosyltransferase